MYQHKLKCMAMTMEMIFLVFAIYNKLFCDIYYSDEKLIHTLFLNSNVPT